MRKLTLAAIAALATISTAALAIVDVNDQGVGFVGKGDVQLKYGWNDQALQRNAKDVKFFYDLQEEYKFDCTFTVEVGKDKVREPRTQNRGATLSVNSSVAYDPRKNAQSKITGFNLNGFGGEVNSDGAKPVEGGHCVGGQFNDGVISDVRLNSSTGGLFVDYLGASFPLPNTPII